MKTIMIDPGHGGSDPGATNKGNEETFNLLTALVVREYLVSNYNVKVLMTRTGDQTLSLSDRSNLANRSNLDFYLSIHHNAGGGTGFESYVYNGSVPTQTLSYQKIIHEEVIAAVKPFKVTDRGKKRANFHVLRETKIPSMLVEVLFVDNSKEVALLIDLKFRQAVGISLAKGVAKALSLPAKESDNLPLFKVIAGSFTERKNAEDRVKELKAASFESFIDTVVVSGRTYYRVQTGAFSVRENAEDQITAISRVGIDAFLLSEGSAPVPIPTDPPPTSPPEPTQPPQPPGIEYSIKGSAIIQAQQLNEYAKTVNPSAPMVGEFYIFYGNLYGIRGDIAYAQAIHETNFFRFTGQVKPSQNNYAGIGTTGPGNDGASFATPDQGVLAHIQHLYAYASTEPLPAGTPLVDPRFSLVARGSAENWTDLNGKWAVPGTTYGQSILSIYKRNIDNALKSIESQKILLNNALDKLK
ncbi:N-acetylmuramoyl-L-alanine amidase [Rossellomorea sp. SC111]|uniref:N-acetylmuramoyl-L-alanine amidase n=1 Tax=Rossellomorea sp. SC111 TaxID=2968985 RepID=UPI00215A517B|nr:N-acetylmuramoyl-L-alanine amidase [Rossellomorea sp. SC111]MCR8847505.1 N-acetylmuramoyl-L-alanine amidase [Rossellomorea sp. SC111]